MATNQREREIWLSKATLRKKAAATLSFYDQTVI
jgi:hypothetical protein